MADVKWIKIMTDIFDDEKIKLIDSMPGGESLIIIWFKLLCMAGRLNSSGVFMMNKRVAYTAEMLATLFSRPVDVVRHALEVFEDFGMVTLADGVISVTNWEKHQNVEGLEKIREQNRNRKKLQREREKNDVTEDMSRDSHVTVTHCHATEEEVEEEKEKNKKEDIEGEVEVEKTRSLDGFCTTSPLPRQVVDLFNEICVSLAPVKQLTAKRSEVIEQALRTYSLDDYRRCFEVAEASSFIKGDNSRGWVATFDWLILEDNMTKVLEGNYTDRPKSSPALDSLSSSYDYLPSSFDTDEFFEAALRRSYSEGFGKPNNE